MKLKKQTSTLLIVLLTAIMVFALAACGNNDTGSTGADGNGLELFAEGKLTVATGEPAWEPWVMNDDPESGEGFEAAIVYALADHLGFAKEDVEWVRTPFDAAIAAGPKDYDFNLQQFSITDERKKVVDFSSPYYLEPRVIVSMKDGKFGASTAIADFKDALFGAASGDVAIQITEEMIAPTKDVQVFNNLSDVLAALNTGQIDATILGVANAKFTVEISDQLSEGGVINGVIPGSAEKTDGLGLLLPKDSPNTAIFSKALDEMTANGTIDKIINEWLSDYNSVPNLK